jgi:integrase
VDPPAAPQREIHPPTIDDVRLLLASLAGDRMEPLYVTAVSLGMREGELLGLRWSDVDLDMGTLTITHTLQPDTLELAEPKTERSKRTLVLPVGVATALRNLRRQQRTERLAAGSRWADRDLVFCSPDGQPLRPVTLRNDFARRLDRLGLPHQRFHDLRHACATLLLEQGEELAVISKVLGHSKLATTADIYGHLTPAMSERVAARMDAILGA